MSSPPPLASSYDNNNEANHKMRARAGSPTDSRTSRTSHRQARPTIVKTAPPSNSRSCGKTHLNSLWSVWYGLFGTFLMAYTAVKCMKRYLRYAMLSWPTVCAVWELQASLLLTVLAVLLLPLFLAAAVFKVGNFANDGLKLGRCTAMDPPTNEGSKCTLWRHGGPTAAFVHLVIAFCLLVPKLVMEARLIEAGYLPQESIWRTDLDFMVVHHDRLVVLSFMTASSGVNNSLITTTLPPGLAPASLETATIVATLNTSKGAPNALPISVVNMLKEFFNLDAGDTSIDAGWGSSVSVEYLNYALALLVYSVRYPAVFWNTNKCFGIVFSLQLLVNSVQSLLSFAGMSVLYKVQIIGAWKALPLLRHYPDGMSPLGGKSPFLLNAHVSLALFALSSLLVLSSSLVLYLYGHGRFNSFLNHQRDKKHILQTNENKSIPNTGWGYFTHCAALCCLLAVAVCTAPLLYDYTLVYRGSLDGAILACIIAGILHLFLWVVVWLFLTIKHRWTFKLRVTVGKATVRSARSVKLVTDIDLMSSKSEDTSQQPLLIVGNGRTYTVTEHSPKKAIMSVVQKATLDRKVKSTASSTGGSETTEDPDVEEQIYWLRPALVSPQRSPDSATGGKLCWLGSSRKSKHKVTFNDATSSTSSQRNKGGIPKSKLRNTGIDEDDGDYATLRELPLVPPIGESGDDTTSEEGKLLACVHDDNVTYASTSRDLIPPVDYEDPSPLLTPEPLSDRETDRLVQNGSGNSGHSSSGASNTAVTVHNNQQVTVTPRCLRRADSGMPHEELTPRSDSISTESSSSPPELPGSNHSETSSGVHSNASSDHHQIQQPIPDTNHSIDNNQTTDTNQMSRRATSVADLVQPREDQWKSCSLQRNVQPPTNVIMASQYPNQNFYNFPHHTKNHSIGTYNVNSSNHNNHANGQPIYGYSTKNATNSLINNSVNVSNSNTPTGQHVYGLNSSGSQSLYGYTSNNHPITTSNQANYSHSGTGGHNIYSANHTNQSNYVNSGAGSQQPPNNHSINTTNQPNYGPANQQIATNLPKQLNYASSGSASIPTTQYTGSTNQQLNTQPIYGSQNVMSSSTNSAQPVYGTSGPNGSLYSGAPVFGFSGTNSPQNVNNTTSNQPVYGYTTQNGSQYGTTTTGGSSTPVLYGQQEVGPQPIYGFTSNSSSLSGSTFSIKESGGIPVILENTESTVVIRRKNTKSVICENTQTPVIKEEPFGRSTNMRMTSFTENNDLKNIQASSATLPHYPTQPINVQNPQNQYSTMPLPLQQKTNVSQSVNLGAGTSCNVFPRQHTTIPTHHNGVRLFPANQNPYVKRFQQNGGGRVSQEGVYGTTKSQNENYYSS